MKDAIGQPGPSVLFITRSYPPIKGGMETLSFNLTTSVSKIVKTKVIANTRGKKFLPFFFISAFCQSILEARRYDVIHIGDPILSKLGWIIKTLSKKPVVMEVHGLDILFDSFLYQVYLKMFFRTADLHICISKYVENLVQKKYPGIRTAMITPGINDEFYKDHVDKRCLLPNTDLTNKKVLLTVCRLVKRKGVGWFVENVMPKLPENFVYIVAGEGPEHDEIRELCTKLSLENRVLTVGAVSNELLKKLYNAADLFIMPNLPIPGDAEGFGIVALEASSCGTPVIASNIEGITDAVLEGKNGWRAETGNSDSFVYAILSHQDKKYGQKEEIRKFVLDNFSWEKIASHYIEAFRSIAK